MRFIFNGRRTNRNGRLADKFIDLMEPLYSGRVWIAKCADTQVKIRVLAAKLHPGAYHDGWSLVKPEDDLSEDFGRIIDDSSRLSEEQIQILESVFPRKID